MLSNVRARTGQTHTDTHTHTRTHGHTDTRTEEIKRVITAAYSRVVIKFDVNVRKVHFCKCEFVWSLSHVKFSSGVFYFEPPCAVFIQYTQLFPAPPESTLFPTCF